MDIYTIFHRDSTWADRGLAGVSLAVNVFTKGLAPNFGAAARTGRVMIEGASHFDEVGDAARAAKGALGRGSTANLSKGTTLPRNLREQLAIEEVISNPRAGFQLPITMTDPRWPAADGWVKMQKLVESGGREGRINVHYVLNTVTGEIDDFKIVLPGIR